MSGNAVLSGLAIVSRVMQAVCQYVLLVMLLITVGQIVARYFFSFGFPWAEEATRYLLVWMILLGAAVLVRLDDHLGIKAFQDALPLRLRAAVRAVLFIMIFCVAVVLAVYGFNFAVGAHFITSAGLGVSMSWAYAALCVGAVPMAVFALVNVIYEVTVVVTGNRFRDPEVEAERSVLVQLLAEDQE